MFSSFWAGIWKYYCHIWNQCPRIYIIAKIVAKIRILKLWTKNVLFGYFRAGIWKTYCHIWNQQPQIFLKAKFCAKMKILKSRTKNVFFWYFWAGIWKYYRHVWNQYPRISYGPKMPNLGILGLECENVIVIFEIRVPKFISIQNLVQEWKIPNLGP